MWPSSPWLLVPFLALAPVSSALASSGDDWLGPDKPKHFAACFALAGVGYGAGALLFESPEARLWSGAGLSLGVGVGKELYDLGRGTRFSLKDLAWDAAGAATGLGVAWLVDRLVFGPPSAPRVTRVTGLREAPLVGLLPRGQEVLVGTRSRFDESHQLLALKERIHRHERAALSGAASSDEHGDLVARALPQTARGHDADVVRQPSLAQRALEPAGQLDASRPGAAAHQTLAADEHLDVVVPTTFISHPSSGSGGRGTALARHGADAPLRGR
ncbi:hypothetical protein JY572_36220 [Myxococcus landrumensis]|uniref:Lipoprotein n=1 Tax=Myxococcus landrumensis TaxID=2813577 RepID=A0ABX7N5P1_9BACT|nr:hypothetical protein JY572_36220 [Myxococcus landrumus]